MGWVRPTSTRVWLQKEVGWVQPRVGIFLSDPGWDDPSKSSGPPQPTCTPSPLRHARPVGGNRSLVMAEAGRRRGCRRRRVRGGEWAEARPQRPRAGGGGPPARVREEARPRRPGAGGGADAGAGAGGGAAAAWSGRRRIPGAAAGGGAAAAGSGRSRGCGGWEQQERRRRSSARRRGPRRCAVHGAGREEDEGVC